MARWYIGLNALSGIGGVQTEVCDDHQFRGG